MTLTGELIETLVREVLSEQLDEEAVRWGDRWETASSAGRGPAAETDSGPMGHNNCGG